MSDQTSIAIVSVGSVLPGAAIQNAADLNEFWANVLAGRSAARRPPPGRWVLSPDDVMAAGVLPDRVYSDRGCFVDDFQFDPHGLDLDAALVARLDPMFHFALQAGRQAWQSAATDALDRRRVGVILGNIALPTDAASRLAQQALLPVFEQQLPAEMNRPLVAALVRLRSGKPISAESGYRKFSTAGRPIEQLNRYVAGLPGGLLAKALGLGGGSMTLDAACASSLYAVKLAAGELLAGRADAMLAGGLSRPDSLYTQMGFSQLRALSPSGVCRPFDARGDGLVVGEGAGIVMLKRLPDALRDGDQIWCTIAGIGLSNDIGGNLMSPDSEGQLRAMRAAYRNARLTPQDISLIECHGTGTPTGDRVEWESLQQLWKNDHTSRRQCVIGSVKSNVGHLLTGAGAAGLIKVLLALRHKQLPPTAGYARPLPDVDMKASPLRVLSKAETWHPPDDQQPRRAAISAFGFGGINAHLIVQEWTEPRAAAASSSSPKRQPSLSVKTSSAANSEPVAIVGIDTHFGPWKTLHDFQQRVLGGGDQVEPTECDNWWGASQATDFRGHRISEVEMPLGRFRIPPNELREMLPQQLLMLHVAARALDDAGLGDMEVDDDRTDTGVLIGIGLDLNTTNFRFRWSLLDKAREWSARGGLDPASDEVAAWASQLRDAAGPPLSANHTMGALGGIVASRIARAFRIGGPSFTISCEEGSALAAIEVGVRALRQGELNVAIVGAVDLAGDVRAVLGQHDRRPYSSSGLVRPLDTSADGTIIGEGAAAVILKRLGDAERDGDRIYAVIRGMGRATGGGVEQAIPHADTYQRAVTRAFDDAQLERLSVDYLETHGSSHPGEDAIEAEAIAAAFALPDRPRPLVLGSVKSDIGHAGAASGLASLVKASLALYHQILPPMRGTSQPIEVLQQQADQFLIPSAAQVWLRDRIDGPRRAGVSSMSVDGNCHHLILEGVEQETAPTLQPLGPPNEAIFSILGNHPSDLPAGLKRLDQWLRAETSGDVNRLAARWWQQTRGDQPARCVVSLVAGGVDQLRGQIAIARRCAEHHQPIATGGVYYSPSPLVSSPLSSSSSTPGQIAWVFPGAGNQYLGMGRELAAQWPGVLRRQDTVNDRLASQFAGGRFWSRDSMGKLSHSDVAFGQVWLGAMVGDLLRAFGVLPDAVIGYSLGETAGLFATGAWTERDEMLGRMEASPLFTDELAGRCEAVRRCWHLAPGESVDWRLGMVDRGADEVRRAIASLDRAYLLIVNSPDECVVGGDRRQIEQLASTLGCTLHGIEGVTTVHCEVARSVQTAYRDLHLLTTTPPQGVRFYSGIGQGSYELDRQSAADSIVGQSLRSFDYSKVIEQAYRDGVRVFVELGPGGSCSRMIGRTLGERPHVAQSACLAGRDNVGGLLHLFARLMSEGVPVDLDWLYGEEAMAPPPAEQADVIRVRVGGSPFVMPQPPDRALEKCATAGLPSSEEPEPPQPPMVAATAQAPSSSLARGQNLQPLVEQAAHTQIAQAQAEAMFLRLSQQTASHIGAAIAAQTALLGSSDNSEHIVDDICLMPTENVCSTDQPVGPAVESTPRRDVALDRDQCMEFAIGSIANVLGPTFASIDSHPTRVRLPDEPLMLVDRILSIDAERGSMAGGRIVTEHDILPGAWYLDGGRIPTCIAVEAGQADLFLSAYLGIDFQTQGRAVYRLLDAVITLHRPLPGPGNTIAYDIRIDHFFRQGDTWLFRFSFEATLDGRPLLSMRDGCAGFFSEEELSAGKGIVQTRIGRRRIPGKRPDDWRPLVPMKVESYDDRRIAALRGGDLAGCFGAAFAGLSLDKPVRLPDGRMKLVHRILELNPTGGRFGLGQITGEADIHPDDWFLTCHFVDDRVMPGTLMYECCLHTLRIFLIRMGWVGEADEVAYQPVPGVASQLKCRGQVLESTKKVQYELTLKEIGYEGPEETPYVLADALMVADGKPIVQMNNMSLRLSGMTRASVEKLWQDQQRGMTKTAPCSAPPLFDTDRILAFATGKPSGAFGDRYRVFDSERVIARLPGPPYQYLDRITNIENCQPWRLAAGGLIVAEYDIPPDAWYFAANRQSHMPFAVLLEAALQPCGWLAAYLGSALASEVDMSFRNLGGGAVQRLPVTAATGTLQTRIKITNVAHSGGMLIQNYDMLVSCDEGEVYRGDTYFGFFSKDALSNQVGIRDAVPYEPTGDEIGVTSPFPYPDHEPYPRTKMRMVDRVEVFAPRGGPAGLGFIRGTTQVDPDRWFFKAHFYQDPVWPGSLGLESMLQLLKIVAVDRWTGSDAAARRTQFEILACGEKHSWTYRGQVLPTDTQVTVQATVTAIDDRRRMLWADGHLIVDGRIIYQMNGFTVRMSAP